MQCFALNLTSNCVVIRPYDLEDLRAVNMKVRNILHVPARSRICIVRFTFYFARYAPLLCVPEMNQKFAL